jgi:hypothetical protein
MRSELSCSAISSIVPYWCRTHVCRVIPACWPEKERKKTNVVTDYPVYSELAAIWARRARAFPLGRPRIGRHWDYPLRHPPYRQRAIALGRHQATAQISLLEFHTRTFLGDGHEKQVDVFRARLRPLTCRPWVCARCGHRRHDRLFRLGQRSASVS